LIACPEGDIPYRLGGVACLMDELLRMRARF
jgi:hypothetical protein